MKKTFASKSLRNVKITKTIEKRYLTLSVWPSEQQKQTAAYKRRQQMQKKLDETTRRSEQVRSQVEKLVIEHKNKTGDECRATDYWNAGPCGPDNPKTRAFVSDSLEETQSHINYLRYKMISHLEKVISQLEAGKCPRSLGHVE